MGIPDYDGCILRRTTAYDPRDFRDLYGENFQTNQRQADVYCTVEKFLIHDFTQFRY